MVWVQLAKDRDQWRIIVNNFIYTPGRYEEMSASEERFCCENWIIIQLTFYNEGGGDGPW